MATKASKVAETVTETLHEAPPAGFDWHAVLSQPTFWVAMAFVIFFALAGKMLWRALTKGLDGRAERIRQELEEARRLREEAEALLATYRTRHAESMKEAEGILAKARADAARMAQDAEAELKQMLAARTRMAEDKIAQAEKQAVSEVRDHVVDITIAAAKSLIIENLETTPGDELIRRAVADLERKVH